jgi:predicted nucleotidyltransferase
MRATGPGQSALLLLDVIAVLDKFQVDYAVVGAMAASFYGPVRASLDADAIISFTGPTRLEDLERELKKAGFNTQLRRGDHDDPISAVLAAADEHGNRVDLLLGLRGMEAAAFARAVEVHFMNEPVRVIGIEDFIAMKVFAGSPKDIDDARNALAVSGQDLDADLLRKLARQYGRQELDILEQLLTNNRKTED